MRFILYATLYSFLLLACKGVKTLEGRAWPVVLVTDSSLFKNASSDVQTVRYPHLMGLAGLKATEVFANEATTILLRRPAFFSTDSLRFFAYPGDRIKLGNDRVFWLSADRNKVGERNRLALALHHLQRLETWPAFPVLIDYSYDRILGLEELQKKKINSAQTKQDVLIDSLFAFFGISKRTKATVSSRFRRKYQITLLTFYEVYNDSLRAHGTYSSKLKSLLPIVNSINRVAAFNEHDQQFASRLYAALFPYNGIENASTEDDFQANFDSVSVNFSGAARAYLLSRIMYNAYRKGFAIPPVRWKQYRRYAGGRQYRKIINRVQKEEAAMATDTSARPNELLTSDGRTVTKLEEVLQKYSGKFVVVDLWASWCRPCLDELPNLLALVAKLPPEQIVFLGISIDTSPAAWRQRLAQLPQSSIAQYLLLQHDRAALYQRLNLMSIPRYLIYNRGGILINPDAPRPSDPRLHQLLTTYLNE